MILFIDRSLGKGIGRALRQVKRFPATVLLHDEQFPQRTDDDVWLARVGQEGWIAMGQDYSHHLWEVEKDAIRTHEVGMFYLWGARATQWEQFRVFARAWDAIEDASQRQPPFLYRINRSGRLEDIPL